MHDLVAQDAFKGVYTLFLSQLTFRVNGINSQHDFLECRVIVALCLGVNVLALSVFESNPKIKHGWTHAKGAHDFLHFFLNWQNLFRETAVFSANDIVLPVKFVHKRLRYRIVVRVGLVQPYG